MARLLPVVVALACAGCVDIYRGALVQFNLRQADRSSPGEHYEMFAVVNGGAVRVARYKILNSVQDCGASPDVTGDVDLVARYDNGVTTEGLCARDRRLGLVDKLELATATLAGGVRFNTPVDLSEAESVFITVEADGDEDPRPTEAVVRGDLGWGTAPFRPAQVRCREDFCAGLDRADPQQGALFEQLCGAQIPTLARPVRGVRRAVLVRAPVAEACNAVEVGELAIVPALDETFL